MKTPEWLKPGFYGVVIGAVCVSIAGFSWGGWMTGDAASKMANTMAHDQVIAAMVPVCLGLADADPDRIANLATIRDATSYNRRDAVMEAGWATVPGSEVPNRDIAKACLAVLDLTKPAESAEIAVETE